MILQWFLSKTVRQAIAMCKHIRKLLNHQRDIFAPRAIEEVEAAIRNVRNAVTAKANKAALEKQVENLEAAANKWIKPYPNAAWRENVEVLLVALSVAMGVRTFFLQPFKIPTGSMQPTLYGITSVPDFSKINFNLEDQSKIQAQINEQLRLRDDMTIPTGWERVKEWFQGISYVHIVAKNDGELNQVGPPLGIKIFNLKQTLVIGGQAYTIWFPPDYGEASLDKRAGLREGQFFHKGEDVVKLKVQAGDHLFVDRLSYNFRTPERGEIVVFETRGIPEDRRDTPYWHIPPDQFYIKRLVGLGGETLSIQKDYLVTSAPSGPTPVGQLVVNGHRVSASTPHFENVYSFFGATRGSTTLAYHENRYYGHAMIGELADGREFRVSPGHFFVMGDNTMNSLDSRYWGDIPRQYVIGKSFFVYWPITERFGWGQR